MALTQNDLTARLQLINCCIATVGGNLLTKIKIGASDVACKLTDLQVMKEMLESVKDFQIQDTTPIPGDVHASWLIEKDVFNPLPQATTFYVDGIAISNAIPIDAFSVNMIQLIVDDINGFQTDYIAVVVNPLSSFTVTDSTGTGTKVFTYITVDPPGTILTITDTSTTDPDTLPPTVINCLTEEQVIKMFDYMAKRCGLCLPIPGALDVSDSFLRIDIDGDIRVTVDGSSREYIP